MAERLFDALRAAGSIPARNNYIYDLHLVVPGLAVCICEFKCFINVSTIQEKFLQWGSIFLIRKKETALCTRLYCILRNSNAGRKRD